MENNIRFYPHVTEDNCRSFGIEVKEYVLKSNTAKELLEKLIDLIDYLVPLYLKEGKSSLVIAIGCTGGKHRSVTFAEEIHKHCLSKNLNSSINHRDITK